MSVTIATFYHFAALPQPAALQPVFKRHMLAHGVTGTILVTPEGLNGTIAGPAQGVESTLNLLRNTPGFATMPHKQSNAPTNPFLRTKVKLKRETIPLGVAINPALAGEYVTPQNWNALISNPDVMVIDTRNDYEVAIGQFTNAHNPKTRTFKQLPAWLQANVPSKSTPIAMYCTGGIRCEKSTAYLKSQGYENVYHLQGGILKYLEDVPQSQSLWQGACYVFDDRVAVNHNLTPAENYQTCPRCNTPVNAAEVRRMYATQICPHCPTTSQE